MNVQLKASNGMVSFYMRAGKDLVRNMMPMSGVESILAKAQSVEDKQVLELSNGMFRCIDDLYFFPLEATRAKRTKCEKELK